MFLLRNLSIQSKLIMMVLFVSVTSIAAVGYVAYTTGKEALTQSIDDHLNSLRASKTQQIQAEIKNVRDQVLHLSEDPMVVAFLKELKEAFAKQEKALADGKAVVTPAMQEKIKTYYRDEFLPALAKNMGSTPVPEAYLPQSPTEFYFQYQYIANNKYPAGQKYMLDDAGDGSDYSAVHRVYQPILRRLVLDFGYDNLYLVDSETGELLYNTGKSTAFATNALTGPYADSSLGEMFKALGRTKDKGAFKFIDFAHYAPSQGRPTALIGSPIFDGPKQLGVLIVPFPIDEINRVMTGNLGWERDGLGKTGEVYLVGPDYLMRSKSRPMFDRREEFFRDLEAAGETPEQIDKLRQSGTAVLTQAVRTKAVEEGLAGKEGTTVLTDYCGKSALTSYAPLDVQGQRWVIVAQIDNAEAFAPLDKLTREILYATVFLVVLVTVVAAVMGHFFVRPIYMLTAGVRKLQSGEEGVTVDLKSKDEFNDLSGAFNDMTASLKAKTDEIARRKKENDDLLLNLLPEAAARRYRAGERRIAEQFPNVTVLFARLQGCTDLADTMPPPQGVGLLDDLVTAVDEAAERHGVEKIKTSGLSYLAVCGLSTPHLDHASRTIEFARDFLRIVRRFNREREAPLGVQIALSSGPVVGGVVGRTRFSYDLFGRTVAAARAAAGEGAADGHVLVATEGVFKETQDLYEYEGPVEATAPDGGTTRVWPLKTELAGDKRRVGETHV